MESFTRDGVTSVVELAPGGALTGLLKRGIKGLPTVAIKTPDDLAAAHELLEAS
jgi:[acyl-carrier-protein] S-malonyltransferase